MLDIFSLVVSTKRNEKAKRQRVSALMVGFLRDTERESVRSKERLKLVRVSETCAMHRTAQPNTIIVLFSEWNVLQASNQTTVQR